MAVAIPVATPVGAKVPPVVEGTAVSILIGEEGGPSVGLTRDVVTRSALTAMHSVLGAARHRLGAPADHGDRAHGRRRGRCLLSQSCSSRSREMPSSYRGGSEVPSIQRLGAWRRRSDVGAVVRSRLLSLGQKGDDPLRLEIHLTSISNFALKAGNDVDDVVPTLLGIPIALNVVHQFLLP